MQRPKILTSIAAWWSAYKARRKAAKWERYKLLFESETGVPYDVYAQLDALGQMRVRAGRYK